MLSKIKLWFFNHKNYLRMSRFLIVTVALLRQKGIRAIKEKL